MEAFLARVGLEPDMQVERTVPIWDDGLLTQLRQDAYEATTFCRLYKRKSRFIEQFQVAHPKAFP